MCFFFKTRSTFSLTAGCSILLDKTNLLGFVNVDLFLTDRKYLQVTVDRPSGLDVTKPKHGKVDETGAPHVGGNTWAGGTGGRDTAGLGGKGGPYRLDAGHKVHQVITIIVEQVAW